MKIDNHTNYDTAYLRRLFTACEKHEGTDSAHRCIKIIKGRAKRLMPWVGGYAWYNSTSVVMKLYGAINARRVAQVYIHEVGHNLGLHHGVMINSNEITIDFWPDEIVPMKQVVAKPKPNLIELRAVKARQRLLEWQHRLGRARHGVRKYQRQVRYYERKMAAFK